VYELRLTDGAVVGALLCPSSQLQSPRKIHTKKEKKTELHPPPWLVYPPVVGTEAAACLVCVAVPAQAFPGGGAAAGCGPLPYFLAVANFSVRRTNQERQEPLPLRFSHAAAESTGLPDASVDLVSMCLMCHELPRYATKQVSLQCSGEGFRAIVDSQSCGKTDVGMVLPSTSKERDTCRRCHMPQHLLLATQVAPRAPKYSPLSLVVYAFCPCADNCGGPPDSASWGRLLHHGDEPGKPRTASDGQQCVRFHRGALGYSSSWWTSLAKECMACLSHCTFRLLLASFIRSPSLSLSCCSSRQQNRTLTTIGHFPLKMPSRSKVLSTPGWNLLSASQSHCCTQAKVIHDGCCWLLELSEKSTSALLYITSESLLLNLALIR